VLPKGAAVSRRNAEGGGGGATSQLRKRVIVASCLLPALQLSVFQHNAWRVLLEKCDHDFKSQLSSDYSQFLAYFTCYIRAEMDFMISCLYVCPAMCLSLIIRLYHLKIKQDRKCTHSVKFLPLSLCCCFRISQSVNDSCLCDHTSTVQQAV
jgi:hypothetical protein